MDPQPPPPLLKRVRASIWRAPLRPRTDRDRVRLAMNDLILHLHPPRVPRAAIAWSYTFGLGGLAVLLLVVLIGTGVLLMFAYTPSEQDAYASVVALETEVWFGQMIRNLHHWSGNLLLIVAGLHMLRVFYTGAHRSPREFNWQLGLLLLGLVALGNFTGYLLPWDQLAYWAVTVAHSMLAYVPLIGDPLGDLLIGGEEVSGATLRNFFALHVILIPLGFLVVGSFHIWRVRKDKFSQPRRLDDADPDGPQMVTTIPHLVSREVVFALVVLALLLGWSSFVDAPLGSAANPNDPPNPTKAAWYFMGVQELLLHFHPTFGAFIIPAFTVVALVALPYLPEDAPAEGILVSVAAGAAPGSPERGAGRLAVVGGSCCAKPAKPAGLAALPAQ
ncbi:MAG: DUF4405 domain-containing protein [Anaerolineae bacterium]|nr:DUF4405 domain-containing protein [Anaerolineae bacterium]